MPQVRAHTWRTALPSTAVTADEVSLWAILKKCIGKDLTRVSLPVFFNEPLSLLQRLAEYMDYAELLEKAAQCGDRLQRFGYVAAFVISSMSFNYLRLSKPFNPLWFETYELDNSKDCHYRFIAEQVSHHPPVSAFHADSTLYTFDGCVSPRLKFWGTTAEVVPSGDFVLRFPSLNETYSWGSLNVSVHNIVMGQMYMELEGVLEIVNNHDEIFKISFKNDVSGATRQGTFVRGHLYRSGKKVRAGYGNWTTFFATCGVKDFKERYDSWLEMVQPCFADDDLKIDFPLMEGSELLWRCRPRPSNSRKMYNFTCFTFSLNDPLYISHKLPRTDCRLRPDVRLMEQGDHDSADQEKTRLEVKQRAARASMRRKKLEKHPKWFSKQAGKNKDGVAWTYNGRYWDSNHDDCEDIF